MALSMAGSGTTFSRSNHSFSGVDIKAVFGGIPIGTLQALSYAITREKAPIYTMGDPDPRAFSRGKRAIAGSMVFILFDRDPLLYYMANSSAMQVTLDQDQVRWDLTKVNAGEQIPLTGVLVAGTLGSDITTDDVTANPTLGFETYTDNADQLAVPAFYSDQVPPFDIDVFAANEYGAKAEMKIIHVELTDEGHGMSVDDVQLGKQMKWIGRYVFPWTYTGLTTGSYLSNLTSTAGASSTPPIV